MRNSAVKKKGDINRDMRPFALKSKSMTKEKNERKKDNCLKTEAEKEKKKKSLEILSF